MPSLQFPQPQPFSGSAGPAAERLQGHHQSLAAVSVTSCAQPGVLRRPLRLEPLHDSKLNSRSEHNSNFPESPERSPLLLSGASPSKSSPPSSGSSSLSLGSSSPVSPGRQIAEMFRDRGFTVAGDAATPKASLQPLALSLALSPNRPSANTRDFRKRGIRTSRSSDPGVSRGIAARSPAIDKPMPRIPSGRCEESRRATFTQASPVRAHPTKGFAEGSASVEQVLYEQNRTVVPRPAALARGRRSPTKELFQYVDVRGNSTSCHISSLLQLWVLFSNIDSSQNGKVDMMEVDTFAKGVFSESLGSMSCAALFNGQVGSKTLPVFLKNLKLALRQNSELTFVEFLQLVHPEADRDTLDRMHMVVMRAERFKDIKVKEEKQNRHDQALAEEIATQAPWVDTMWIKWDTDGNGELDREEFAACLADICGEDVVEHDLDEYFDQINVDGSGLISKEQFSRWWASIHLLSEDK
ncbi:hypothetical protein CYMTET_11207 [Cymbomonas tetramitiformis]|uniref:EF-hand domain-containing protein n=1 Tax=Cymbomonas tetramitiformis TaxID=36881 RepID=A0AAE0LD22_9CHLO|nr:hypothetical protein CYMTET_27599 [Cymbomonas tetramitiformis]KAK3280981.1 hypothetical protein CYMTET_11207 [Cymbomonas tetramitiformis]